MGQQPAPFFHRGRVVRRSPCHRRHTGAGRRGLCLGGLLRVLLAEPLRAGGAGPAHGNPLRRLLPLRRLPRPVVRPPQPERGGHGLYGPLRSRHGVRGALRPRPGARGRRPPGAELPAVADAAARALGDPRWQARLRRAGERHRAEAELLVRVPQHGVRHAAAHARAAAPARALQPGGRGAAAARALRGGARELRQGLRGPGLRPGVADGPDGPGAHAQRSPERAHGDCPAAHGRGAPERFRVARLRDLLAVERPEVLR
mmetsp:Transcript_59338/g.167151  ORF Transcript_59338/g.167151 Transcript_59338/m.167151 type:complete len:259 (-) Transcript_59338:422-1198(-)